MLVASPAGDRGGGRGRHIDEICRAHLDVEASPAGGYEDGRVQERGFVKDGRQPLALPKRADPACHISRCALGDGDFGHDRALPTDDRSERLEIQLGVDRHDGDHEPVVDLGDKCLEHSLMRHAECVGGLDAVGTDAGIVFVWMQPEGDAGPRESERRRSAGRAFGLAHRHQEYRTIRLPVHGYSSGGVFLVLREPLSRVGGDRVTVAAPACQLLRLSVSVSVPVSTLAR